MLPIVLGSVSLFGGVAAFKALLMLSCLRKFRKPEPSPLCMIYSAICGLQAALWAASIWAEPTLSKMLSAPASDCHRLQLQRQVVSADHWTSLTPISGCILMS